MDQKSTWRMFIDVMDKETTRKLQKRMKRKSRNVNTHGCYIVVYLDEDENISDDSDENLDEDDIFVEKELKRRPLIASQRWLKTDCNIQSYDRRWTDED